MTEKTISLADAEKLVIAATETYNNATVGYENARRAQTNALNNLNEAQNKLDEAVEMLKGVAPDDTNWTSCK